MGVRQEVEALFFGSGVQDLYEHWQPPFKGADPTFQRFGEWSTGEAPNGWAYQVQESDPLNDEKTISKVITYSVLVEVMQRVTSGRVDVDTPFHPVSEQTDFACTQFIHTDSLEDFDPYTIDEILQIAVYGGVWHPHFKIRKKK